SPVTHLTVSAGAHDFNATVITQTSPSHGRQKFTRSQILYQIPRYLRLHLPDAFPRRVETFTNFTERQRILRHDAVIEDKALFLIELFLEVAELLVQHFRVVFFDQCLLYVLTASYRIHKRVPAFMLGGFQGN